MSQAEIANTICGECKVCKKVDAKINAKDRRLQAVRLELRRERSRELR